MQKKPITNKLLWIFAVGQFGWSLLSGIVSNWMVYYYTGSPDAQNPNTGIFAAGTTTPSTLSDEPFAWHTITLSETVQTSSIRITIDSTYPGSRYTDTCISEITIQ